MHFPTWSKIFVKSLFSKIWAQFLGAHADSTVRKIRLGATLFKPEAFIRDLSN